MELWFSEKHTKNVQFSIKIDKQLFSEKTEHQRIDVFESADFGRCLVLDGSIMFTEKDEFVYHEMIVHPALAVHPNIKSVLVIGAGDGGVVRELCQYPNIEQIDLVEIDQMLIYAAKKFLPHSSYMLSDKRVNIIISDGLKFVRKCEDKYDLIIVDSPDPYGPAEPLFTKEFYGNCYKALKEDGIMVNQHESPFYEPDAEAMQKVHKNIYKTFEICRVYQAHIPSYPSGHWLFGFASKKYHPLKDLKEDQWNSLNIKTKYYNINLHKGAFYLPNYVTELLKHVE
ncbi:MAG TPA: polyamine aminopropyltransferase [Clostridia bacterium]|jgi:spermidine synthase